jgi:predicted RNA-binding protein with TRAM domain
MRHERSGGNRGFGGPRNFAPVKVGDELDVKIEAVGEKGDGIAKKDGFVLFVPSTKQGDNVRIRVTRVLQKVGFAEVVGQATGESQESSSDQQQEGSYTEQPQQDSGEDQYSGQDSDNFGEEQ